MLAADVASHDSDIPNADLVINYDIPRLFSEILSVCIYIYIFEIENLCMVKSNCPSGIREIMLIVWGVLQEQTEVGCL